MKVYVLGGSRNIGYYTSLRILEQDEAATLTFLLRNPSAFDNDEVMQKYIKSGRVNLVKGDALNKEDVRKGWVAAGEDTTTDGAPTDSGVDLVLFTVGGYPKFKGLRLVLDPQDLCTRSMLNTLSTIPPVSLAKVRIVAVTTTGLTDVSHASLPLPVRLLYNLLGSPHDDKRGAEALLSHCVGGDPYDAEVPGPPVLSEGWEQTEGLPPKGGLKRIVRVWPALLTDGPCKAETKGKGSYRVRSDRDLAISGGYTVSRRDVAHLIATRVIGDDWAQWEGKVVNIAY